MRPRKIAMLSTNHWPPRIFQSPVCKLDSDEAIWHRFCSNFPSNSAILRLLNCPGLCHVTSWLMCVFWWNFLWLCQVRDIQSIGNGIRTILECILVGFYGFVNLQRWQVSKKWRFLGLKKIFTFKLILTSLKNRKKVSRIFRRFFFFRFDDFHVNSNDYN